MKIIQIGPFPLDSLHIQGGVEASVYGLSVEISKLHDVSVIDFPRSGVSSFYDEVDGIKVFRLKRVGKWNISSVNSVCEVRKIVLQEKPDICHIHGTSAFACQVYRTLKDTPRLLTVHGLACEEKKKQLAQHFSIKTFLQLLYQSYFERILLFASSCIIADTEYVKNAICDVINNAEKKITVIPQGISPDYFKVCREPDTENPFVLSVGSISARKGHLILMRSFNNAWIKDNRIRLVIAGSLANENYFREMIKLKEELECADAITIIPNIARNQLMELYKTATLFALHSQEESQGIVFAEAMACGLPIVSTLSGGIPYVVRQNVNGLLSKYGDIDAFTTNVLALLSHTGLRNNMSEENYDESRKYDWETISCKVCKLYNQYC